MNTISKNRNGKVNQTSHINPRLTAQIICKMLESNGYVLCFNRFDEAKNEKSFRLEEARTSSCYLHITSNNIDLEVRISNHSKRNLSGDAPDVVDYYYNTDEVSELNIFDIFSKKQALAILSEIV